MAENSLCSECSAAATHFCICRSPLKLYFCETCCSRHVLKGDVGHSTLRIKAAGLVITTEDIRPYNSRLEAVYQLNTSLDSLYQQACREKEELQVMVGQFYEKQVAELYAAYTNIWLTLQAKYDSILQELSAVKSEVSNLEQSSVLSPITTIFIESYVHIQPEILINCATELQTRVTVQVQPPQESLQTPLQEILTKWRCAQCQQCAAFQEKIFMNKVRKVASDKMPELHLASRHIGSETTWRCKCGKVNPVSVSKCDCGDKDLAADVFPIPAAQVLPITQEAVTTDIVWKCKMCLYEYNLNDMNKCYKCKASNPRLAEKAQQSLPTNPRSVVQTQQTVPDLVWTCENCRYGYNVKNSKTCLRCKTPKS